MFKIVKREEMAEGTVILNEIEAPLIAKKAKPGQFVILKANEDGERIPLTMADTDPDKGTITIIYMVVGKSTALFKTLKEGDGFQDVIGPLGKPTHLEKVGKVVCVGGGTGVAVLHPITRALKQVGNDVTCIIGARTKDLLILEAQMKSASHDLKVCTDDGTYGHHGFVTDVLKDALGRWRCQAGGGHRAGAHDAGCGQSYPAIRGQNPGEPQSHYDRRYGHVRGMPGFRGW
jgi:ferredoxin--NADP+ reductase